MRPLVNVVTSGESASRDASAIAAGVPGRALMQRAGAAAAAEIALRWRDRLAGGVLVVTGPGNNGGDGWVVARALAASGVRVRVLEALVTRSPDGAAERALATPVLGDEAVRSIDAGDLPEAFTSAAIVVDAMLGTGATGAPRGAIASGVALVSRMREHGAAVAAIDLPTGVDATTGEAAEACVRADLTLTFGTVKRGHLVARDQCGAIVVLDIGLDAHARPGDGAPVLIDEPWVAAHVPPIPGSAHKGVRKKLAIVGGAGGMAGASMLAARAALRSGIGMVKLFVARESVPIVQEAEPYALAAEWPRDDTSMENELCSWADAVVVGPGLGRDDDSRALLDRVLRRWRGPTLLDADAITIFENRARELGELLAARPALLTPHPIEFARLAGMEAKDVLADRFTVGVPLASTTGAAVLLKGVPTVIAAPDGGRLVSASGTAALATAGSGDVLSGIAGTMLAQTGDPFVAGAIGAWVHGRAAERVPTSPDAGVRGIALEDVVAELRESWTFDDRPTRYPVLVELPASGDAR
ncbi:MAG TPA: NAD(P)H-hydrate dehydratase [Gemmatimonadaceae bacterium]|nr:NAD(P)H-hydrate dehydratase [Gemmatimonadaceae bacterium]